jgi:hypothetical protein
LTKVKNYKLMKILTFSKIFQNLLSDKIFKIKIILIKNNYNNKKKILNLKIELNLLNLISVILSPQI